MCIVVNYQIDTYSVYTFVNKEKVDFNKLDLLCE